MRITVEVTKQELMETDIKDIDQLKDLILGDLQLGDYYYHAEYPGYNIYVKLVDDCVL